MRQNPIVILCLTLLFSCSLQAEQDDIYIFGYGSLMLTLARTATVPDPKGAVFVPVKVKGLERLWNLWAKSSSMRVLGIEESNDFNSFVNGLLFSVKREELAEYDRREGSAYRRIEIPIEKVTFYREEDRNKIIHESKQTRVFIYMAVPNSPFYFDKHDTEKEIATSYLNVVQAGCIEVDSNNQLGGLFINDCVQSLGLKGYRIEDDSAEPRYSRSPQAQLTAAEKKAHELKRFVEDDWPDYLKTIKEKWEE